MVFPSQLLTTGLRLLDFRMPGGLLGSFSSTLREAKPLPFVRRGEDVVPPDELRVSRGLSVGARREGQNA
jgi:hypothetical protein